ncbi:MAG: hypothetical protein KDA28_02870 [Phycisphaerales bacterium]|nr:hypothetical protein [Phycisphaerales bacterium]
MKVILDDTLIADAASCLSEALQVGVEHAEAKGRVIVEASADGHAIPGDLLEAPDARTFDADEITLTSAEPRSLVHVTLMDAVDALEDGKALQREVSSRFEVGETEQGIRHLQDLLEIWQTVQDVLDKSSRLLEIDLDAMASVDVAARVEALHQALEAVRTGVEQQDWSQVADVVGYDLTDEAGAWQGLLRALADAVRHGD